MRKIRVVVDNRVRVYGTLPDDVVRELKKETTHVNPAYLKKKAMGYNPWPEPAAFKTWALEDDHWSFARGACARILKILRAREDFKVIAKDHRVIGEKTAGEYEIPDYGRPLWPHQQRALDAFLRVENCIVRAPTGSGKTGIGLAGVAAIKLPSLIVAPNGTLFDQWIDRVCDPQELGLRRKDVGIIRGKTRKIRPVTVAIQKSLWQHGVDEELRAAFGVVILDEVQGAPAKTVFGAIDPFPARYRLGISADERRKDGKECLTRELFGEVAEEITVAECEAGGYILNVEIRIVETEFEADWYRGETKTTGFDEFFEEPVDGDEEKSGDDETHDFDLLLKRMAADAKREKLLMSVVLEEARRGRQVLVFCRRRAHVFQLDQALSAFGMKCGVILGGAGTDEKVKQQTIAGFKTGKVRIAIGTIDAMGTGTDLPKVEVGVLAAPLPNKQLFNQVRGRICRSSKSTNKSQAILYVLADLRVFPGYARTIARQNRSVKKKTASTSQGDLWESIAKKSGNPRSKKK